jgi:hypothetical protein
MTVYKRHLKIVYRKVEFGQLVVGTTLDIYVFITEDSDIEDLLQSTGDYITASTSLSKGTIQIKQCTDANRDNPAQVRTRVGLGGEGKQSQQRLTEKKQQNR